MQPKDVDEVDVGIRRDFVGSTSTIKRMLSKARKSVVWVLPSTNYREADSGYCKIRGLSGAAHLVPWVLTRSAAH